MDSNGSDRDADICLPIDLGPPIKMPTPLPQWIWYTVIILYLYSYKVFECWIVYTTLGIGGTIIGRHGTYTGREEKCPLPCRNPLGTSSVDLSTSMWQTWSEQGVRWDD